MADWERKWDGYGESHASEDYTNTTSTAQEAVTCAWSDKAAVYAALLGSAHSDYAALVCTGVTVAPAGDAKSAGGPKTARMVLSYKDRNKLPSGNTVTPTLSDWVESWQGGGEAITIGKGFKWADTGVPVDSKDHVSAVKLVPQATISLSGKVYTNIGNGKAKIFATLGKINVNSMTIKGLAYTANTLLLTGVDMQETPGSAGSDYYSITYKFSAVSDHSWQNFWRQTSNPPGWETLVSSDGNTYAYETAVFSDLDPKNW